jgi:hypothetical protein
MSNPRILADAGELLSEVTCEVANQWQSASAERITSG